jgi:hypothetical protein
VTVTRAASGDSSGGGAISAPFILFCLTAFVLRASRISRTYRKDVA